MYAGTKSDKPPPPLIRMEKEVFWVLLSKDSNAVFWVLSSKDSNAVFWVLLSKDSNVVFRDVVINNIIIFVSHQLLSNENALTRSFRLYCLLSRRLYWWTSAHVWADIQFLAEYSIIIICILKGGYYNITTFKWVEPTCHPMWETKLQTRISSWLHSFKV